MTTIKEVKAAVDSYVRANNSAYNPNSGLGGCSDFGAGDRTGANYNFEHNHAFSHENMRKLEWLYYTDWGAKKIVDIPVEDALREPFEFKGLDEDESKKLNDYLSRIDFYKKLEKAMKMERLYGGSALFLGTAEADPELGEPIKYSSITENDLVFVNPVNRISILESGTQTDPTLPGFCDPTHYTVYGNEVAANRLMVFDGAPLCRASSHSAAGSYGTRNNDGFGFPILLRIEHDLARATGARQAASHLIDRAAMLVFLGDIQSASALRDGSSNVTALKQVLNSMSNYQAALINSTNNNQADVKTLAANFSSIPELMREFDAKPAAAVGIPITRWLGESPGGLNSSGEGEREDYNNTIRAIQRHRLAPQLNKRLLPILLPSAGVDKDPEEVEIIFPALWSMTDLEKSQIRAADVANVSALIGIGAISDEEGVEELLTRDGLNIEPTEFPGSDEDFDEGNDDADTDK